MAGVIRRVAKVNSAPEGPAVSSDTAIPLVLPGTALSLIEWPDGRGCMADEILEFTIRDEKGVSVLLEPTTATAQFANRSTFGNLGIDFVVDCFNFSGYVRQRARGHRFGLRIYISHRWLSQWRA